MRIQHFFRNKPPQEKHPFKQPSTWQPPQASNTKLEEYIQKTREELNNSNSHPNSKSNLSKEEKKALKELRENKSIIIKQADKGNGIVVENTEDYIANGLQHLGNTQIYKELDEDPTVPITEAIKKSIDNLHETGYIDDTTRNYLTPPENTRTQRIYFLKKLHKNPHGIRPIVSGINGPTERLSSYIDHYLKPTLSNIPSLLNNTQDAINIIEKTKVPPHTILATIDVSNLYLNIPQDEGTNACLDALENTDQLPLPREHMKAMFDFVLKENVFAFGEKTFKQVQGTAMGTKMAPSYANTFMHTLEQNFLQQQRITPALWKRYIDDILMLWTDTQDELDTFIHKLNQHHPTIKFTYETSTSSIDFLDLTIYKGKRFEEEGILDVKTHFKPTNTFQYLHHKSAHPKHIHKAVITGEAKRFLKTNSDETNFNKTIAELKTHLLGRDYPHRLIDDTLETIHFKDRPTTTPAESQTHTPPTTPVPPLSLTTDFQATHPGIKRILRKHWNLIEDDHQLNTLFPKPPILTTRKPRTLGSQLVRSKLDGDPPQADTYVTNTQIQIPHRTPRCKNTHCKTCPKLLPLQRIQGFPLTQKLNCGSRNVIYAIRCSLCKKLYIGQTSNPLRDRITHHRSAAKHKKNWPIYRHFSMRSHDFERDHQIIILETCRKQDLLEKEKSWIRKLDTVLPKGLNSIFSLLNP